MSGISVVSRRFRLRSWFDLDIFICKLLRLPAPLLVGSPSPRLLTVDKSISLGGDFYTCDPAWSAQWNVHVAEGCEGPPGFCLASGWRLPLHSISFLSVRRRRAIWDRSLVVSVDVERSAAVNIF